MRRFTIGILMLMTVFSISAFAQQARQIRVSVDVAADELVKSQLVSNVNSSLRALGDVIIVNNEPKIQIQIVALKSNYVGGRTAGYAISIVVLRTAVSQLGVKKLVESITKDEAIRSILLTQLVTVLI